MTVTIPDVEYLEAPRIFQVHSELYVSPAHVSAVYLNGDRVPVIRLVDGHEFIVAGYDLAELAAAVS